MHGFLFNRRDPPGLYKKGGIGVCNLSTHALSLSLPCQDCGRALLSVRFWVTLTAAGARRAEGPTRIPLLTHQRRCQPSVKARPCLGILCAGTIFTRPSCRRQWGCRASMRKCYTETMTGQSLCSPLLAQGGSLTCRRLGYPSISHPLAGICPQRRKPMKMCNPYAACLHTYTGHSEKPLNY